MTPELEDKIVRAHPLLFRDRYGDMRSTCMVWGLSCGNGWFQILWDLSEKLEPLIQKFIDDNPNLPCYSCSCSEESHDTQNNKCNTIRHLPFFLGRGMWGFYPVPNWKRDFINSFRKGKYPNFKFFWFNQVRRWMLGKFRKLYRKPNRFFYWLYKKFGIGYNKPCHCKGYKGNYPCASQIKEKFGTLRVYMTHYLPEMEEAISEAERLSAITCEDCGQPGELRQGGWLRTLCDECESKQFS